MEHSVLQSVFNEWNLMSNNLCFSGCIAISGNLCLIKQCLTVCVSRDETQCLTVSVSRDEAHRLANCVSRMKQCLAVCVCHETISGNLCFLR
jgi:hypothetical protein